MPLPDSRHCQRALACVLLLAGAVSAQSVERLATQLADPSPAVRKRAITKIGALGKTAKRLVPAVVKLLDDPDTSVAVAASATCARLGGSAAAATHAAVSTLTGQARVLAAAACVRLGIALTDAECALVRRVLPPALQGEDAALRREAIRAAQTIREPSDATVIAVLAATTDENTANTAHQTLRTFATGSLPRIKALVLTNKLLPSRSLVEAIAAAPNAGSLLAHIADAARSQEVHTAALSALGSSGWRAEPFVATLEAACRAKDPVVRAAGIAALARVTPDADAFADILAAAIKNGSPTVRRAAYESIGAGALALPSFTDRLIADLHVAKLRGAATRALARCGQDSAEPLRAILNSKNPMLQALAGFALAGQRRCGDAEIDTLIKLAANHDRAVRATAIAALGRIGTGRAAPVLVRRLKNKEDRIVAAFAIGDLGPTARKAIPTLSAYLRDKDPSVRRAAARALGKLNARKAVAKLVRLLRDPDAGMEAARALAALGSHAKRSLSLFLAMLRNSKTPHREFVAWLIGELRSVGSRDGGWDTEDGLTRGESRKSVRALLRVMEDREVPAQTRAWSMRSAAKLATRAELTDKVFDALAGLTTDTNTTLGAAAIEGLATMRANPKRLAALLVQRLDAKDRAIRLAVLSGVAQLRPALDASALETIAQILAEADPTLFKLAAAILAQTPAGRTLLGAALHKPATERAAVDGLSRTSVVPNGVVPRLIELAREPDSQMREQIAQILAGMKDAHPRLALLVDSDNLAVRRMAGIAFATIGRAARGFLDRLATDNDELIRTRAQRALARLGAR